MKCPKCGNILDEIIKLNSREYHCSFCNYGVSAYVTEPIDEDETIYKIKILSQENNISQIKLISKVGNINYLISKRLLDNGGILIEDTAKNVLNIREKLDALNIKYSIIPEFKW